MYKRLFYTYLYYYKSSMYVSRPSLTNTFTQAVCAGSQEVQCVEVSRAGVLKALESRAHGEPLVKPTVVQRKVIAAKVQTRVTVRLSGGVYM
jgi:hypothetical protein